MNKEVQSGGGSRFWVTVDRARGAQPQLRRGEPHGEPAQGGGLRQGTGRPQAGVSCLTSPPHTREADCA